MRREGCDSKHSLLVHVCANTYASERTEERCDEDRTAAYEQFHLAPTVGVKARASFARRR